MSRCRKCGAESWGRNFCNKCMKNWLARRTQAYEETKKELGELSPDNLNEFKRRIKQKERQLAQEEKKGEE